MSAAGLAAAGAAAADEDCILVLQGGGALGAYQAGVFEALCSAEREPNWVAGISIGAINAALIVGNPPELRLPRLREFWELVSNSPFAPPPGPTAWRELVNDTSAAQVMAFGVPGFFTPRLPPPLLQPRGTLAALSWYDTTPLRATLERLVDFRRLNEGPVRLSIGAVDVESGNFGYFDNRSPGAPLDARHILASGALPPGFAPVEIDRRYYWDGGLVSNTPLQYVLDEPGERPRAVFQVDLFTATGPLPATLAEVAEREKDIRYSSRTRLNTDFEVKLQELADAARRLAARLPAELRDDPDLRMLTDAGCAAPVDIVQLIYRSKHYETQSKDYEFSRRSMVEHWQAGLADMAASLQDPRWLRRRSNRTGSCQLFDHAGAAAAG